MERFLTGKSVPLRMLIVAWGAQAIVAQSLLMREALGLMFGSELAWGIVLFAWLAGVSLGGAIGGLLAGVVRDGRVWLVVVLILLSGSLALELYFFGGARRLLQVGPGELMPLATTAFVAILFVSPVSMLVGIAFPLACRVMAEATGDQARRVGALGGVYAWESIGSLIGGAAFSFWAVDHLSPIETTLLGSAITLAACAILLSLSRRSLAALLGITAAALGIAVGLGLGEGLNDRLVSRKWEDLAPGYELVAHAETKYQSLAIARRSGQFTLYCDGQVAVDFPDPYTYAPLAHFWMCQHPNPKRVLVIGGLPEGILVEALAHPIEHIDLVETDPQQYSLIKPFLSETYVEALGDERVGLHHVDPRHFVKAQRGKYDLVIARFPEPTSALHSRLYTAEFFEELRRSMTDQAVVCMTAKAAPGELSETSGAYLASVRATVDSCFSDVVVSWGDPAHLLLATAPGLVSIDPEELHRRFVSREVESRYFHPLWFEGATDWLDADKLQQRKTELDEFANAEASTDLKPIVYMQRLSLWEKMIDGEAGRNVERALSTTWGQLAVLLAVLAVLTQVPALWARRRSPKATASDRTMLGAVLLSVSTTGFATMALSVVWLFAFQNLYGFVYQRIGWIIAVFMGGLVLGSVIVERFCPRSNTLSRPTGRDLRLLLGVDCVLSVLAISVPLVLPVLGSWQSSALSLALVEWVILTMVLMTGILGGSSFALAGRVLVGVSNEPGRAVGLIVWADHAGACVGALLTGVLLVPVFGVAAAALCLFCVKIVAVLYLAIADRLQRGACSAHPVER